MIPNPTARQRFGAILLAVIATLGGRAVAAQEPDFTPPTDEPSSSETLMERSDLGNVVAAGKLKAGEGSREMKRAAKLEKKRAAADAAEQAGFDEKIQQAYQRAADSFTEAIRTSPNLLEAYAGLGQALARLGKLPESLRVHAAALGKDPADEENFRGWAGALLEMNMLGDATRAYTQLTPVYPQQAQILLELMQSWLERRREDPGDLAPEDVERLASWLAEQG